jgi:hypothetical protein
MVLPLGLPSKPTLDLLDRARYCDDLVIPTDRLPVPLVLLVRLIISTGRALHALVDKVNTRLSPIPSCRNLLESRSAQELLAMGTMETDLPRSDAPVSSPKGRLRARRELPWTPIHRGSIIQEISPTQGLRNPNQYNHHHDQIKPTLVLVTPSPQSRTDTLPWPRDHLGSEAD